LSDWQQSKQVPLVLQHWPLRQSEAEQHWAEVQTSPQHS
jgi:hypothetical protein